MDVKITVFGPLPAMSQAAVEMAAMERRRRRRRRK